MKGTLFAIILSIVLNIMPIGHLTGTPSDPLLTNFILIKLAPANNYIPNESELDAAKASIENRLTVMDLYDFTVTSDKKENLITVHIPEQSSGKKFTLEEIASELCKRVEVKLLDPEGNIIVEGKHINKCITQMDTQTLDSYVVRFEFNEEGKKRFADATARLIGQEITIYVDGKVISSAVVEEAIPNDEAVINKIDTGEEALAIANKITAGMLPYELILAETLQVEAPKKPQLLFWLLRTK